MPHGRRVTLISASATHFALDYQIQPTNWMLLAKFTKGGISKRHIEIGCSDVRVECRRGNAGCRKGCAHQRIHRGQGFCHQAPARLRPARLGGVVAWSGVGPGLFHLEQTLDEVNVNVAFDKVTVAHQAIVERYRRLGRFDTKFGESPPHRGQCFFSCGLMDDELGN